MSRIKQLESMPLVVASTPLKICLLGAQGCGKTAIVVRFARKKFNTSEASTIGAAFVTTTVKLRTRSGTERVAKFDIWDTAGQEQFESLTPMYYRGAHAVIIVYDITDEKSFSRARHWVAEICRNVDRQTVPVALVGNKNDLADVCRVITHQTGRALADEQNLKFFETSAKTNIGINELFVTLAEEALRHTTPQVGSDSVPQISSGGGGTLTREALSSEQRHLRLQKVKNSASKRNRHAVSYTEHQFTTTTSSRWKKIFCYCCVKNP